MTEVGHAHHTHPKEFGYKAPGEEDLSLISCDVHDVTERWGLHSEGHVDGCISVDVGHKPFSSNKHSVGRNTIIPHLQPGTVDPLTVVLCYVRFGHPMKVLLTMSLASVLLTTMAILSSSLKASLIGWCHRPSS